jgi:hypothetical protein
MEEERQGQQGQGDVGARLAHDLIGVRRWWGWGWGGVREEDGEGFEDAQRVEGFEPCEARGVGRLGLVLPPPLRVDGVRDDEQSAEDEDHRPRHRQRERAPHVAQRARRLGLREQPRDEGTQLGACCGAEGDADEDGCCDAGEGVRAGAAVGGVVGDVGGGAALQGRPSAQ